MRSLKFNAVMNMILTSSSMIFPLITVPYVSRVLEPSGMGAVSFAQSLITYFSIFSLLGIPMYGVRACAQVRDDPKELGKTVEELLIIILCSTSLIYTIYLVCIFAVPRLSQDKLLYLIFSFGIWLASFGVEWFYQAIEQYGYITIRSILFKFVGLILMFLFVHDADDYHMYGFMVAFTGYGANVVNVFRLRKLIVFQPLHSLCIRRHFKPMRSFFVSSVSSGLYAQADIVLLGFLSTNAIVGIYQLVAKIKNMFVMAINSIVNVMLPRLSYYAKKSSDQYNDLLIKNFNTIFIFSFAGIGVAYLCATDIIALLGGDKYSAAHVPFLCILPAFLFVSLNTVLSQYLISSGGERQYAIANSMGLASSVLYCLFFIPKLGAMGAALSCSLCEFTALLVRCWFAKSYLKSVAKNIELWQAPCSALVAFSLTLIINSMINIQNSILHIGFIFCLFGLFFLIVLIFTREKIVCSVIVAVVKKKY